MVQIKVTASILIAAAAIVPVIANGFEAEDSLVLREDSQLDSSFARELDLELEEREFEDDLVEREPLRGLNFIRKAQKYVGSVESSITPPQTPSETREFNDDLLEREFDEELSEREVDEELSGREFDEELSEREFDEELSEREFDEELSERDLDEELSEREFDEELSEREFEDELTEREVDGDELFDRDVDSELFEREPEPFLFFNRIKTWWKDRKGKKTDATPAEDSPETRSFDEMELLERDYYDELD